MSALQVLERSSPSGSPSVEAEGGFAREAFTKGLRWLQSKGVVVDRYDVADNVAALDANVTVKSAFDAQGPDCLPVVVVDGTIISVGGYPTRTELTAAIGLEATADLEFVGDVAATAAALGATMAANSFNDFQLAFERLRQVGLPRTSVVGTVQLVLATAGNVVSDDMRTRVEQFLVFGPQGPLPKAHCTCGSAV